jgi:hypothetical protein
MALGAKSNQQKHPTPSRREPTAPLGQDRNEHFHVRRHRQRVSGRLQRDDVSHHHDGNSDQDRERGVAKHGDDVATIVPSAGR